MNKEVTLELTGSKAIRAEIIMEAPIIQDLQRLSGEFPQAFGNPNDPASFAGILANNKIDANASTVKLRLKDGDKYALDFQLPWNQVEDEFNRLSEMPCISIYLVGTVG